MAQTDYDGLGVVGAIHFMEARIFEAKVTYVLAMRTLKAARKTLYARQLLKHTIACLIIA